LRFRRFCSGSLALASLDHTCRDHIPDDSATFTTVAFADSSLRWFEISTPHALRFPTDRLKVGLNLADLGARGLAHFWQVI
jgi:hypothetical protein